MNVYDLIIVGGGPGGYAAAVRAGKLGLKTMLVEKDLVGGACVNWGCVPAKALLKYAKLKQSRSSLEYAEARDKSFKITKERREKIEQLFVEGGIELLNGKARLISAGEIELWPSGERISGKNIILATGFTPKKIAGVEYDGEDIVSAREAMKFEKAPDSVVIIGSGATGMELATVWNSFGTKVTVLEMLPQIMGLDDDEISKSAVERFRNSGMQIITEAKIKTMRKTAAGVEVFYDVGNTEEKLIVEKVLIAIGVVPNSGDIGLEKLEVEFDRGYIKIDEEMRTNIPGIYAVGDVTGKLNLALAASEQGTIAVDAIAGQKTKKLVYENLPRCIYSCVEVASVGLSEKKAKESGYEVVVFKNSFKPYGKAAKPGEEDGIIKVIADANNNKALGAVMLGHDATGRIAGPMRMINLGADATEVFDVMSCGR